MSSTHARLTTVLVVEDEFLVRLELVNCLEEAGFFVLEATNAAQAIAILESRSDIRLVFTDVNMPGSMDGLKLAAAVGDRWPPVKIIVTSGQTQIAESELPLGSRFFSKPYELRAVAQTVSEMIEG